MRVSASLLLLLLVVESAGLPALWVLWHSSNELPPYWRWMFVIAEVFGAIMLVIAGVVRWRHDNAQEVRWRPW